MARRFSMDFLQILILPIDFRMFLWYWLFLIYKLRRQEKTLAAYFA